MLHFSGALPASFPSSCGCLRSTVFLLHRRNFCIFRIFFMSDRETIHWSHPQDVGNDAAGKAPKQMWHVRQAPLYMTYKVESHKVPNFQKMHIRVTFYGCSRCQISKDRLSLDKSKFGLVGLELDSKKCCFGSW